MFDMVPFRKNNSVSRREDDFDRFFDNFFSNDFFAPMNISGFGSGFKVDLKETENSYLIEADLPGVTKDAIDIDFNNNYLTITAKREDNVEDKSENFVRRERHYGEFKRSFYIDNVVEDQIDASFNNGVLKVTLPKSDKGKTQKKRIDIH